MNYRTFGAAAALIAFATLPAHADENYKSGADDIGIIVHNSTPVLTVRNTAQNKQLSALALEVQENGIAVELGGHVDCKGTTSENLTWRHGWYFGAASIGIGEDSFVQSVQTGTNSDINVASHMAAENFDVSLATLGDQAIGIDPVALVMQKAAQHGGGELDYLREDRSFNVTLPVRFEAQCNNFSRNKITKKTVIEAFQPFSYVIKDMTVRIDYQGDPGLYQLNAQIANMNQNGGIQAQDQNFINVTGGSFLEGEVHKQGECPMTADFKLKLTGAGDGDIKIRIADTEGTFQITTASLDFDQGSVVYDFSQDLKLHDPNQMPSYTLNKKIDHLYRVWYSAKTKSEQFFPANYQPLPVSLSWSHTCIKEVKLNPVIVGTGGGKFASPQHQNQSQGAQFGVAPVEPSQAPLVKGATADPARLDPTTGRIPGTADTSGSSSTAPGGR